MQPLCRGPPVERGPRRAKLALANSGKGYNPFPQLGGPPESGVGLPFARELHRTGRFRSRVVDYLAGMNTTDYRASQSEFHSLSFPQPQNVDRKGNHFSHNSILVLAFRVTGIKNILPGVIVPRDGLSRPRLSLL